MSIDTYQANRRKFPRKSFRKALSFISNGSREVVEGVEIGEGGVSFKSQITLQTNQRMVINFFLPDGSFFSVKSTVRNIQKGQVYGVSFDEVSLSLKRQIRAYVARTSNELLSSR